jgi:hypothetical protein
MFSLFVHLVPFIYTITYISKLDSSNPMHHPKSSHREACSSPHLYPPTFQALYLLLAPHTSPLFNKHCPLHSFLCASTYLLGSTAMPALGPFASILCPLLVSSSGTSICSPTQFQRLANIAS